MSSFAQCNSRAIIIRKYSSKTSQK